MKIAHTIPTGPKDATFMHIVVETVWEENKYTVEDLMLIAQGYAIAHNLNIIDARPILNQFTLIKTYDLMVELAGK